MQIEIQIRDFVNQRLLFDDTRFHYDDGTSFLASGIVDSMGVLELADFAAKEFGLQVDLTEVTPENFDSVQGLAAYIRRKLGTPVRPA